MHRRGLLAIGALVFVGLAAPMAVASARSTTSAEVALSAIDTSTTPTTFTLSVDVPGADSAKLVLDGRYIGSDKRPPLTFDVVVAPGVHKLKVRTMDGSVETRTDAQFVASGSGASTASTKSVSATTSSPSANGSGGEVLVDTVAEIRTALATAAPGAVIRVADGQYVFKPRLVASASGTPQAPITLVGSRDAVLRTNSASGDYGLHITGDHWRVQGLTVAHGSKGIVLDGSVGTVIDGVEVHDIGAEAVHFRACSSDGVLRNSYIHDTGRTSAQYGEGVYVGSANSNWSNYQCADGAERVAAGDNTERVLIEDNVFEDITAEGADLKEGTDSGILRRNLFRRAGTSGMNSADSAVDAKGNNWVIEDNVVTDTTAPWVDDGVLRPSALEDGFQTHSVYTGYGVGNVFHRNRVEGTVPGFGIGMYPGSGNVVSCDNSAPGAAKGLVGDRGRPSTCLR